MAPVVLATRNAHKLREFGEALPGLELVELPQEVQLPPEGADSFAANAIEKARTAHAATGIAAIADDSGIVAYALGGKPGVLSARYAGEGASDEQNLAKLIGAMMGSSDKRLAYVCALSYFGPDGEEELFEGRCEGTMAEVPRGDGGFGYDPVFLPDDTGPTDKRTMAELSPDEKHAISHRGKAARQLAEFLADTFNTDSAQSRHPRTRSGGDAGG